MKYKYKFRTPDSGYSIVVTDCEPKDAESPVVGLIIYLTGVDDMNWREGFWYNRSNTKSSRRYNEVHRPQIIEQAKIFMVKEML